jgi:uncharacterized protein YndB with AHSA1/START domain
MMDLGTYVDYEGKPAVRFERTYPHSITRVWEAVTTSEDLARWFPSAVTHEARVGGSIEFQGDPYSDPSSGTILEFDPETSFAYTWGPDELHFELEEIGESCKLVLINVLAESNTAARNASGWHVCLAELEKVLASEAGDGPHSEAADAAFEETMAKYVASGMPSGAGIPPRK